MAALNNNTIGGPHVPIVAYFLVVGAMLTASLFAMDAYFAPATMLPSSATAPAPKSTPIVTSAADTTKPVTLAVLDDPPPRAPAHAATEAACTPASPEVTGATPAQAIGRASGAVAAAAPVSTPAAKLRTAEPGKKKKQQKQIATRPRGGYYASARERSRYGYADFGADSYARGWW